MARLKTKVVINSVTIKDDDGAPDPSLLINWEYEATTQNGISELNMRVTKATNTTVALANGQTIEIWEGLTTSTDTKIFSGFIAEYTPEGGIISLRCYDKMWDLVRKNVNQIYLDTGPEAGQISAIASDLITTYAGLTPSVEATGTAVGETVSEFKCKNTDIYERLIALAKAVDYQLWYDVVNDTVHFESKGFNDSGQTLTVGTEILNIPSWKNDIDSMINDLRVEGATIETQIRKPLTAATYGTIGTTTDFDTTSILLDKTPESVNLVIDANATPTTQRQGGSKDGTTGNFYYVDKQNKSIFPVSGTTFTSGHKAFVDYTWLAPIPIHMENSASKASYGNFEKTIKLNDVISVIDAEARAQKILDIFSIPFQTTDLLVKIDATTITLKVGDKVRIVDSKNNPTVNKVLVINKLTKKFPGSVIELTVGDRDIRLADWQMNVEERLKRLEEETSTDDLILELFNAQNTQTDASSPRWFKMQSQNIGGDVLVWGNTSFGTWNSFKWGNSANTGFILGHSTSGVLGTNKLGTQNSAATTEYLHQYQNIYTEDFIDADFKDTTNNTSTWGTTGSTTFTSGQIAQSDSIDFNNGTITAATLTSTEASGTLAYFMKADGVNNVQYFTKGVFSSSPTWVTGTVGSNALDFNAGKVDLGTYTDLDGLGAITIAFWIKPTTQPFSNWQGFFARGDSSNRSPWIYGVNAQSKIKWDMQTDVSNNDISISPGQTLTQDVWTHLIFTWDGGGDKTGRVYFDNVVSGTTDTSTGTTIANTIGHNFIGNMWGFGATEAVMDELLIYNRVITSAERATLFAKGEVTSGRIARFSMEEGSGTNTYDTTAWEPVTSGAAHTFTNSGTDLRWLAVEAGGTTAEISKVIVNGYH